MKIIDQDHEETLSLKDMRRGQCFKLVMSPELLSDMPNINPDALYIRIDDDIAERTYQAVDLETGSILSIRVQCDPQVDDVNAIVVVNPDPPEGD